MRSVLLWKDMDRVAEQMDAAVFQYVGELQTESFEAFADFDLLAFDWYDVRKAGKSGKVLVYIDREDLFSSAGTRRHSSMCRVRWTR